MGARGVVGKKQQGTGKKKRGGGKDIREESLGRYLHKVLKQVHPELGISSKAMDVMQSFMVDSFERLAEEAGRLTVHTGHKTLTSREMQTAVRLMLPGALGANAISEGKKAVTKMAGLG